MMTRVELDVEHREIIERRGSMRSIRYDSSPIVNLCVCGRRTRAGRIAVHSPIRELITRALNLPSTPYMHGMDHT